MATFAAHEEAKDIDVGGGWCGVRAGGDCFCGQGCAARPRHAWGVEGVAGGESG